MLNQLVGVCGDDCGITNDIIDIPSFDCDPDSLNTVIYIARLEGTSERDSGYLISVIEDWVRDGASIRVAGIIMTANTQCTVAIPSLNERECVPTSPEPTPNTDSPTTNPVSNNIAAIIGGAVAFILIIAITVVVIVIVVLTCHRRGNVSIKNGPEK